MTTTLLSDSLPVHHLEQKPGQLSNPDMTRHNLNDVSELQDTSDDTSVKKITNSVKYSHFT